MTHSSQKLPAPKRSLFGFRFDKCTLPEAVELILDLIDADECGHYIVTPNLDHAVLLHNQPELADVYTSAALVVADGFPIIWASKWLGEALPERVAGSDLVPAVLKAARRRMSVYLLGAPPGVAQKAAANIERAYPKVQVVGVQSPPVGFEKKPHSNEEAVAAVARTRPDVLVLGLGAPKQELWAHRERGRLQAKVILCAGATIDFLAGERRRAPGWSQRYGLEWAFRALSEPRRLIPRYARDAVTFPKLLAKEWLGQSRQPPDQS